MLSENTWDSKNKTQRKEIWGLKAKSMCWHMQQQVSRHQRQSNRRWRQKRLFKGKLCKTTASRVTEQHLFTASGKPSSSQTGTLTLGQAALSSQTPCPSIGRSLLWEQWLCSPKCTKPGGAQSCPPAPSSPKCSNTARKRELGQPLPPEQRPLWDAARTS